MIDIMIKYYIIDNDIQKIWLKWLSAALAWAKTPSKDSRQKWKIFWFFADALFDNRLLTSYNYERKHICWREAHFRSISFAALSRF